MNPGGGDAGDGGDDDDGGGGAEDQDEGSRCCRCGRHVSQRLRLGRRRRRPQVCLFGLSGDPPTGEGGHAGIVRALLRLRARSFGGGISSEDGENDGGGGRNRRSGTSDSNGSCSRQSDASSNATGLTSSPSSSSSCCGCSYAFDQVWILPVYRHPFQEKQSRLESFEHRMRMCELAFADLHDDDDDDDECGDSDGEDQDRDRGGFEDPARACESRRRRRVVVSDAERGCWEAAVERARAGGNDDVDPSRVAAGTASLIDHLRGAHPDLDFHFCLGEDSFLDLVGGKWKESDRVLESLRNRLWVVQRSTSSIAIGDDGPGSDGDGGIKGRSSSSDGSLSLALRRAVESAGARLLPVPGATAVSSSRVRACPDLDDDTRARNLVPSQVLQYMRAHRLYSFGER